MSDNRIKGFFYPGNAVHGEPDYGLADTFVRTAEAFANSVKTARRRLYEKLGVSNITEAISYATNYKLV